MLKTVSSITNAIGALNFKGTWNATTNTPTIVSGVGVKGDYFVVGVAGSTVIDGISNWGIGDWIVYNGNIWQRVEGGADLNGVNLTVTNTTTLSGLTASTALALNASKEVVSVTNTGTGDNVLATSPTLVTPILGTPQSGVVTNLTGTASININGTVGATTAAAGSFTTLNTSGQVVFNDAGADVDLRVEGDTDANLLFVDASTDRVGIGTTSPAVKLDVVGQVRASTGILFGTDTAAANALDDYEEGTFTATIIGSTTAGTASYTAQTGQYTKIGNTVAINLYIEYSGGTGTGSLRISGLPFTSAASRFQPITIGQLENITKTLASTVASYIDPSTTTIIFIEIPTGGGANGGLSYDAAGNIFLSGVYFV